MYCSPSGTRKLTWCTGTKEECEAAKRKLSQWSISDEFEIEEL